MTKEGSRSLVAVLLLLTPFYGIGIYEESATVRAIYTEHFGQIVNATVTDKRVESDEDDTSYVLEYQYMLNGIEYTSHTDVDDDYYFRISVGDRLHPRVSPFNPDRSLVSGHTSVGFLLGWGIFWNGCILAATWWSALNFLRAKRLAENGLLAVGRIVSKDESTDDGSTTYSVRYEFKADGSHDEVVGKAKAPGSDHARLETGAEVTVLYNPANPAENELYGYGAYEFGR